MTTLGQKLRVVTQRTGGTLNINNNQSLNAFLKSVKADISGIMNQMNTVYYPLVNRLSDIDLLNALDFGITGNVIFTHNNATAADALVYYDSNLNRPRTIKETIDVLLTEISNLQNTFDDQFDPETYDDTELRSLISSLGLNLIQLKEDTVGPDYTFDNDGAPDLVYPLAQHIDAIGTFFTGFPTTGNTYDGAYPGLSLVVNLSDVVVDTTLSQATITGLPANLTAIRDFIGMDTVGPETPTYTDHVVSLNHITDGQSLEEAIATLDNAITGTANHASTHIRGGSDEIDGDQIDIDYVPTTYIRDSGATGVTHVEHLTAHLAGIDDYLSGIATLASHASTHIRGGSDEINGDRLDIDYVPTNYTRNNGAAGVTHVEHLTAHLAGLDDKFGSLASSPFTNTAGVINNTPGAEDTDDFVFGAGSLNDTGYVPWDERIIFDKSSGSFRAGSVQSTQWDTRGDYSAGFGRNTIATGIASLVAGLTNTASGDYSAAIGQDNIASGNYSFTTGNANTASGTYSSVLSSTSSVAAGSRSIVTGSALSNVAVGATYSAVHNSNQSDINGTSSYSEVIGSAYCDIDQGTACTILNSNASNLVGTTSYCGIIGSNTSEIQTGCTYSFIIGANTSDIEANCNYSTILGGQNHLIGDDADYCSIIAGSGNEIETNTDRCTILGGQTNTILSTSNGSSIVGSFECQIDGLFSGVYSSYSSNIADTVAGAAVISGYESTAAHHGALVHGSNAYSLLEVSRTFATGAWDDDVDGVQGPGSAQVSEHVFHSQYVGVNNTGDEMVFFPVNADGTLNTDGVPLVPHSAYKVTASILAISDSGATSEGHHADFSGHILNRNITPVTYGNLMGAGHNVTSVAIDLTYNPGYWVLRVTLTGKTNIDKRGVAEIKIMKLTPGVTLSA